MVTGIFGSAQEPKLEAFETSPSPLRFGLKASHGLQPVFMVIVRIHNLQPEGPGITGALVLPDLIFLTGIYVRIAIVYDRCHSVLEKEFDDGAGAWGTTGVEKDLGLPQRHFGYFLLLGHKSHTEADCHGTKSLTLPCKDIHFSYLCLLNELDMGIIPARYISELAQGLKKRHRKYNATPMSGWLALSPLPVFLGLYLLSSIIAHDFYRIPISAAFLLASIYAIVICRGKSLEERVAVFSEGAGNRNVLLMIWIFVLAGAFAATAKQIGAIDATVNIALRILPGRLLYAGLFLAACFISMSVGTSVGTIVALVPVAAGIAQEIEASNAFITAIIVGGAFFGDNLSFISDTTIAATRTQECSMSDKFKVNLRIVGPAALIVTALYIFLGRNVSVVPESGTVDLVLLIPYLLVIVLAITGINVSAVLTIGLLTNAVIGFSQGSLDWSGWLEGIGSGISGMGDLIIVTMLAGGMLEVIRENGGLDFIFRGMTRRISGKRGAELSIAGLVSLANLCTANNTIAIITTGGIARDITQKFGLDPRKSASIMDTFSCLIQGLIPYGAQLLMAAGLSGVSSISIIGHLYYPFVMGAFALGAIFLRLPRRYS